MELKQILGAIGAGTYADQVQQAIDAVDVHLQDALENVKDSLTQGEIEVIEGLPAWRVRILLAKLQGLDVTYSQDQFDLALEGLALTARAIASRELKQTAIAIAEEAGKWILKVAIGAAITAIGL